MYKYILRFSLVPGLDFQQKCDSLLEFVDNAQIDDVMFFISPEEVSVGHITIEMAKAWIDPIKKLKKILSEKGVTVSLNPWATLDHYDGGRKLFDGQNFSTLVGEDGKVCEVCACPLDQNWRKYFVELWQYYVNEIQPDVIWIEDDLRLTNHEPVCVGCFCDKHMKLYNDYLGTSYDRETFIEKLATDQDCRRAYYEVGKFTIEDTFKYIVSALPQQKTFGLMTGGAISNLVEGRVYDNIYDILSANGGKPYNRVNLGAYRQCGMQKYAWGVNGNSFLMRNLAPDKAKFVSEIEDYPHGIYSKSANFLKYQLLTSAPLLLSGATLSIFDFHGNGIIDGDRYANVLAKVKPYLSKVETFNLSPTDQLGVYCLYNEQSPITVNPKRKGVGGLHVNDGWWFAYLTGLGIASRLGKNVEVKGKIVAVSGQTLRNYSEKEIRDLFRYNFVLLNADATETLIDLGLGDIIGAKSYTWFKERTGKYTFEELATGKTVYGVKKLRATAQFFCGDYLKIDYQDGLDMKVYTNMLNYDQNVVGQGITRVGNALIFPLTGRTNDFEMPISLFCHLRDYVLRTALKENPVSTDELFIIREENVCPYVYTKNSKTYIFCVNFSDDRYSRINIDTDGKFFTFTACTVGSEKTHRIAQMSEDGKFNIQLDLLPQSSAVLICSEEL